MEAIISAAETGFTGSLVGSSIPCKLLTRLEPPHWYRRPTDSWIWSSGGPTRTLRDSTSFSRRRDSDAWGGGGGGGGGIDREKAGIYSHPTKTLLTI
uniref:Uncharacterized protein n=1 Tax=Cyclopterus lumpus TaxID=8103 RepID=A0A8C2ZEI1_CYCLU